MLLTMICLSSIINDINSSHGDVVVVVILFLDCALVFSNVLLEL